MSGVMQGKELNLMLIERPTWPYDYTHILRGVLDLHSWLYNTLGETIEVKWSEHIVPTLIFRFNV